MGVRLEAQKFHVARQRELVVNRVRSSAGRDIDVLTTEPQHHGRLHWRGVGEVQPDLEIDDFGLGRWQHVQFNGERTARCQAPGEPRW